MAFEDWIIEGITWWGEQLWYFMRWLPPEDWVASPLYEAKVAIYFLPIAFFYFLPWILYFRARRKKKNDQKSQVKSFMNSFVCPYCGYIPDPPPGSGVYYCAKCGKSSTINK